MKIIRKTVSTSEKEIAYNAFMEGASFSKSNLVQSLSSYFEEWWLSKTEFAKQAKIDVHSDRFHIKKHQSTYCECKSESGYEWEEEALVCVGCGKPINQEVVLPQVAVL